MKRRWWLYALLLIFVALSVGVGTATTNSITWEDPNGNNRDILLGSQAEWVFITIDGQTIWMSWKKADELSKKLDYAVDCAREYDKHFIERR